VLSFSVTLDLTILSAQGEGHARRSARSVPVPIRMLHINHARSKLAFNTHKTRSCLRRVVLDLMVSLIVGMLHINENGARNHDSAALVSRFGGVPTSRDAPYKRERGEEP
jgi:uncharacterized protein (DUF488 family)